MKDRDKRIETFVLCVILVFSEGNFEYSDTSASSPDHSEQLMDVFMRLFTTDLCDNKIFSYPSLDRFESW